MKQEVVDFELIPTTFKVKAALKKVLSGDDIDLRDVTKIAHADPAVLAKIILLVNKYFAEKNRPVVNSIESAINLVSLNMLKDSLSSLPCIDDLELSEKQKSLFNLIRNRICISAAMTKFWGDYMGEKSIEEQYCASMFTGLNDIYVVLKDASSNLPRPAAVYSDSIEKMQSLYNFEDQYSQKLPESIQNLREHSICSKRLQLSILVYDLIANLEYGYSVETFNIRLQKIADFVDLSVSRAAYDLSRELVSIERRSKYSGFFHTEFLLSTNLQALDPIDNNQCLAA